MLLKTNHKDLVYNGLREQNNKLFFCLSSLKPTPPARRQ